MSQQREVLSQTEMDNGGFLGETTQVALVTDDLFGSLDQLVQAGIGPWQIYEITPENTEMTYMGKPASHTMRIAYTWHGAMMWEVIEPTGGKSIYQDFLDSGSKGFHHVTVDCNGIPFEERRAELISRGFEEVQGGVGFNGRVPYGYFHSGQADSPVLEIVAFPDDFEAPPPDQWYPAPPPA